MKGEFSILEKLSMALFYRPGLRFANSNVLQVLGNSGQVVALNPKGKVSIVITMSSGVECYG